MKAEVKGRWHFESAETLPHERWYCSECDEYSCRPSRYCPECGARMSVTKGEVLAYVSTYESETVRTYFARYLEEKGLVEHEEVQITKS